MYPRQSEGQQSQPPQGQRHWDQGYRGDPNAPPNQPPPNAPYNQAPVSQPPHISPNRPDMAAMHPQYHHPPPQQDYRLPPPGHFYPPQQDMYRQQQPPVSNMNQTAPRQRTAIACKYCRRRKIRCSGFENSEDGRCSNCVRFNQECIFTPVSAQTQAFVPVQAVHGRGARAGGANAPQLYGSYGQPLRPQEQYAQYQHGYGPLPSPTGPYPPPGQYMQPYPPPQPYSDPSAGRRRTKDEPHTPTLPPPGHGHHPQMGHPEGDAHGYNYPDPTTFTNGATSPAGNPGNYGPGQAQPYYGQPQQPRRTSPGSAYSYGDPSRDSGSPYGPPPGNYTAPNQPMPPNQAQPPQGDGRTPPPNSGGAEHGGNRNGNGMAIRDIVSETDRNTTDKNMVSALDRTSTRR